MQTFGELKTKIKANVFPTGEAPNLVAAHNKAFVDALMDLQEWVDCLQQDNTQLVDQCATLFNCGLTVFDAPRGIIRSVSVIDRVNATTGKEDATADLDWCAEIYYRQIDPCLMHGFLARGKTLGCCPNIPAFFCLSTANKGAFPAPTDEGLGNLPLLPLGHHYGQASTDATCRSLTGVWAIERGHIYIAPWIQSTETAVVRWDGLKRSWADADIIDDDPLFERAIEEWVRADHAGKFDRDYAEETRARSAYNDARQTLIHQCREETRTRECEPSHARASSVSTSTLYYNDEQQATATCTGSETGNPVTVTIQAGTFASSISKADANQKALNEAQLQANAQLDCTAPAASFTNDEQSYTASCDTDGVSPIPDGSPVTVTVEAGTVTSTLSKAEANALALAQATATAIEQLACTYWNSEQSFTAECPDGQTGDDVTITVAAHTYSSDISQADADTKALNAAKAEAEGDLICDGGPVVLYLNTTQQGSASRQCIRPPGPLGQTYPPCILIYNVTVAPGYFTSTTSQVEANILALNYARSLAVSYVNIGCAAGQCGTFNLTYP